MKSKILLIAILVLSPGCQTIEEALEEFVFYNEQTQQYVPNPETQEDIENLGEILSLFGVPYAGAGAAVGSTALTFVAMYFTRKKKRTVKINLTDQT